MKLNRLILAAVAALFVQSSYAQQPYGGCWHPDDIKNWSPETDKDAKFNRSRVPLAKRFKEPTLMKANKNQRSDLQRSYPFPDMFDVSVAGRVQLPRLSAYLLAVHGQARLLGRFGF